LQHLILHARFGSQHEPECGDRGREFPLARTSWPLNSARPSLRNLSRSAQKDL
jgi:hypothetical protein